jgi:hypothetical protein
MFKKYPPASGGVDKTQYAKKVFAGFKAYLNSIKKVFIHELNLGAKYRLKVLGCDHKMGN